MDVVLVCCLPTGRLDDKRVDDMLFDRIPLLRMISAR